MRGIALAGVVTAALTLAACSSSAGPDPFSNGEVGSTSSISIYALNRNQEDVTLYLLTAEGARRLGSVAPEGREAFHVRWSAPQEVRVRVEIFAGPQYTTNSLATIAPGEIVDVLVPRQVRESHIRRR